MVSAVIDYFKTGPSVPLLSDLIAIRRFYGRKRWSILLSLIFGYAFFHTCRLGLSVTKKPLLDAGVMSASEMGIVGSVLLYVYAIGKFVNGMLSDHANIRRFMSWALLLSAAAKIAFGYTHLFAGFIVPASHSNHRARWEVSIPARNAAISLASRNVVSKCRSCLEIRPTLGDRVCWPTFMSLQLAGR